MPPRVSTGDRDAVLRQIRWCAAVQKLVNCHCRLEDNPVGDVEPMQLVMQYLTNLSMNRPHLLIHPIKITAITYFKSLELFVFTEYAVIVQCK